MGDGVNAGDRRLNSLILMCLLLAAGTVVCPPSAHGVKPLSKVHAKYDNNNDCTRCHDIFGGMPRSNCLDCHKKIASRIKSRRGYHGRVALTAKCHDCHREHRGRSFDITPLDRLNFDHRQTGWALTGGHKKVPCRQCHSAKRPETNRDSFLDSPTDCQGCHGSYHGKAEKVNLDRCKDCHSTQSWSKLNRNLSFDHNRQTRFPLSGQHKQQPCDKCHLNKRQFGPIKVSGCVTCHKNPHPEGVFGQERLCEECHMTSGFKQTNVFDHATVNWPLRGRHRKNACLDCHTWKQWKPKTNDCVGCHVDTHEGQFRGQRCDKCHQQAGFTQPHLKFNHNSMSRFPLTGRHQRVECSQCHPKGHYKPINTECRQCHEKKNPHGTTFGETPCSNCHSPVGWYKTRFDHGITGFDLGGRHASQPCYRCHPNGTETEDDTEKRCSFCHTDVHQGQFNGASTPIDQVTEPAPQDIKTEAGKECNECHAGFSAWTIPFFDHNASRFTLSGKHQSVPCSGCHPKGHFKPIDPACGNCHFNFHEGQFSQACDECHTPAAWAPVANFDHNIRTQFTLEGVHEEIDCGKCHIRNQYKGTPKTCDGCHLDVHQGKLGPNCQKCHTISDWSVNTMQDHDFGPYRLEGAHDLLACERCHGPDRQEMLAGRGPECVNCHRDPHFGSFGPQCFECHSQTSFLPSTFLHNETGFRLSGAHRFVPCKDCHPGRVFGGLPNDCFFCHTKTFQETKGSPRCDHTACIPGGEATCHNCHRSVSWVPARPGVGCGLCESSGQ